MTDRINKKLHAHDKMLENINAKLDEFFSALKNQLSFNKMIETVYTKIWKEERGNLELLRLYHQGIDQMLICISWSRYSVGIGYFIDDII